MSHVLPFTIDGYTFTHTDGNAELDSFTRAEMSKERDKATGVWRPNGWGRCLENQTHLTFAVTDSDGDYFGSWMMYRVQSVDGDPNVISALLAPMFPDIEAVAVVGEARAPSGEILNADEVAESQARWAQFWRRNFAWMEWQVMNPMPLEGGGNLVVDHWRFPQTDDGDPAGQCWQKLEPAFEQFSKLEVDWNNHMPGMGPCPARTTGWKAIDPDPGRARGSIHA